MELEKTLIEQNGVETARMVAQVFAGAIELLLQQNPSADSNRHLIDVGLGHGDLSASMAPLAARMRYQYVNTLASIQ
jgi:hypothetical protein